MIRVRAEAVRSISSAAAGSNGRQDRRQTRSTIDIIIERGDKMVELDQFKTLMNAYEEPLAGMRDSL